MRIGIFGGSFNPPHIAHLAVAEQVAEAAALDRILWIPAAASPHKVDDLAMAPAEDRLEMVRLATSGNPGFEVSDIEIARGGVSYMVDTLRSLVSSLPDAELKLIVGQDALNGLHTWREPESIVKLAPVLVYGRPGAMRSAPNRLGTGATAIDGPPLDLSSTYIRDRIRAGKSVRYLIPEEVRAYIAERGLYPVMR